MPGILSDIFDSGDDTSENSQTTSIASDGDLQASPEINVGHEVGGSYENMDGSTTTWSSETQITLTVDVDAAYSSGTELSGNEFEG